ncbi:MAG: SPOR domain-containing protein [Bacteroidetes bacterium]|nr:SPOR domain-containing protein [Bacteroidota bacterium]
MPDLNLIDEGGFEESPAPAAPPVKKKAAKSSGGGGGTKFLIIILILAILGAAAWFLDKKGIVKLWSKKKAPIAQFQDEPFAQDPAGQFGDGEMLADQQPIDTSLNQFTDITPVEQEAAAVKEEVKKEAVKKEPAAVKEKTAVTESASNLNEMSGEFTIQVIAYRDKSRADETAKNLEYAGYPSFVEKIPMSGGNFYTVRIGRYPTREAAQKAVKTFAAQLQSHYVIDKVRNN